MKLEHVFIFIFKLEAQIVELLKIFFFFYKSVKLEYLFKWKVSSFSDYYWFLYSNKNFTFLKRYI